MSHMPILSTVGSEGVLVPVRALESIGLQIGDRVDVTLGDGQLVLRPAADATRQQRIDEITREVFDRRKSAYERLA
jgi:antitoxin component of MazEF toxin-antitoxin module